jgi:predicted alpha/beta-hydrolase family hydrolase
MTFVTFISEICRLAREETGGRLLVVGHSLGGAMGQLFSVEVDASSHIYIALSNEVFVKFVFIHSLFFHRFL